MRYFPDLYLYFEERAKCVKHENVLQTIKILLVQSNLISVIPTSKSCTNTLFNELNAFLLTEEVIIQHIGQYGMLRFYVFRLLLIFHLERPRGLTNENVGDVCL